jgi:hypothetical protein
VACLDDYITISESYRPSRSGLYADQLPGISEDLIDNLARDPADDAAAIWPILYKRSTNNLISDISMNLQNKFFMDKKLISRETSQYKDDENENAGVAGVKLEFDLPKYGKLHVVKLEVWSDIDYGSPGVTFKFYDTDENGELLYTLVDSVSQGRSIVNVDRDFDTDALFISYETAQADFRQTENKYYDGMLDYTSVVCDYCYWDYYQASVTQVNGGGINAFFNIRCSVSKYVCENINLFRQALLYRIGLEITNERRIGERLTRYTTMTSERAQELTDYYTAQYNENLSNALKNQNMNEDPVCFQCKPTSYVRTDLP